MEQLLAMLDETVDFAIREHAPNDVMPMEWDFDTMEQTINSLTLTPVQLDRQAQKVDTLFAAVKPAVDELKDLLQAYNENEQIAELIPQVMLMRLDAMWVKHLEAMAHLKEGIGLRHYQQEDPMRIYQREGLELFGRNYQELRRSVVKEVINFAKMLKERQEEQQ